MKFYIQNTNAGYLGNAIVFWAKNSLGYTADLNKSHQFTEEEAREICVNNPDKNLAWPVDYIDANEGIQPVVDHQFLDFDNIHQF